MIYWVYCDYSLLESTWSKLLALLDLIIEYIDITTSAASILNQNEKKRTRFGLVLNKNEQLLVFNFQN